MVTISLSSFTIFINVPRPRRYGGVEIPFENVVQRPHFPRHCLRSPALPSAASSFSQEVIQPFREPSALHVLALIRAAPINRAPKTSYLERSDNEAQGHESSSTYPALKGRAKLQDRKTFRPTGAQYETRPTSIVLRFHLVGSQFLKYAGVYAP